ncbi:hypothetical protein Tco_0892731 [Tanacetum coccineum]|uniref:CCHC-type domain-containing protein n=1 Tax=Tanacetum coccineum TaxID=301880 RepID=A0ABQ5CCS6_9ASTR
MEVEEDPEEDSDMDIDENEEDEWEEDDDYGTSSFRVRKVNGASDAQVANGIAIGELQPRMTTVEEGVRTLAEQGKLVAGKLDETKTQALEMRGILDLMCPDLVTLEKKKTERYIRGLPEKIKVNVTSSKPSSLHYAINMARELIEQAIQAKATRIGESYKRKWEDHQRNNNNHNHNIHHQQQNRRQEDVKAFTAALADRKGYLRTRPLCNQCNLHHEGQCPPKCKNCKRIGHQTRGCWSKTNVADKPPTANDNA